MARIHVTRATPVRRRRNGLPFLLRDSERQHREMYPPTIAELAKKRGEFSGETEKALQVFSQKVLAEGVHPGKVTPPLPQAGNIRSGSPEFDQLAVPLVEAFN